MNILQKPLPMGIMETTRGLMEGPIYNNIRHNIDAYGTSYMGVFAGENNPSFTYSIGLFPVLGYELIMIGLRPTIAHVILTRIEKELRAKRLEAADGKILRGKENRFANHPLMFKSAHDDTRTWSDFMLNAELWWGGKVPVFQIVMSDSDGKLPHEEGFNTAQMSAAQPLLYK